MKEWPDFSDVFRDDPPGQMEETDKHASNKKDKKSSAVPQQQLDVLSKFVDCCWLAHQIWSSMSLVEACKLISTHLFQLAVVKPCKPKNNPFPIYQSLTQMGETQGISKPCSKQMALGFGLYHIIT
jgi:DNA relaxase NicK